MIIDTVYGFLGSGKTTFIKRVLQNWGQQERIVVLVNEFGEVGIDGTILQGYGPQVVEMASGCICCSLQSDFKRQLLEVAEALSPDRVIIEPTGVASIRQVMAILGLEVLADVVSQTHNILVADATTFFDLYKANRHFMETQIEHADLALLNKCDLASAKQINLVQNALASIKPELYVLKTEYGAVDWDEYHATLQAAELVKPSPILVPLKLYRQNVATPHQDRDLIRLDRHMHLETESIGLGLESCGWDYGAVRFNLHCLTAFFDNLSHADSWGEVVRAKGIFNSGQGWQLLEIASGVFSRQPIRQAETSKLVIIGRRLALQSIAAAAAACLDTADA